MAMRKTRAVTESKMLSHLRLSISSFHLWETLSLPLGPLTSDIEQLVRQLANGKVSLAAVQLNFWYQMTKKLT